MERVQHSPPDSGSNKRHRPIRPPPAHRSPISLTVAQPGQFLRAPVNGQYTALKFDESFIKTAQNGGHTRRQARKLSLILTEQLELRERQLRVIDRASTRQATAGGGVVE